MCVVYACIRLSVCDCVCACVRVCVCVCGCVCGCMGVWVYGCVGVWVCGCVGVWVCVGGWCVNTWVGVLSSLGEKLTEESKAPMSPRDALRGFHYDSVDVFGSREPEVITMILLAFLCVWCEVCVVICVCVCVCVHVTVCVCVRCYCVLFNVCVLLLKCVL